MLKLSTSKELRRMNEAAMPEWTVETLKQYVDALREADQNALQAALSTADRAVEVGRMDSKDRLEQHNGLIAQMRDQAATFATRDSLSDFKEALERRISATEKFNAKITGALILVGSVGVATLVKVFTS